MKTTPSKALLLLVAQLKTCPSRDNIFSEKMLNETWAGFRQCSPEQGEELTPAMMAGLILYDERFAQLLNEAEHAQMTSLANLALERYQRKLNPNKLGKTLAAALKEKT